MECLELAKDMPKNDTTHCFPIPIPPPVYFSTPSDASRAQSAPAKHGMRPGGPTGTGAREALATAERKSLSCVWRGVASVSVEGERERGIPWIFWKKWFSVFNGGYLN